MAAIWPSMSRAMNSASLISRNDTVSPAARASSETRVRRYTGSARARARRISSSAGSWGTSSMKGRTSTQSSLAT
jgi:hypothetical protein